MCLINQHIFGECRHTYKIEVIIRCHQYRWWGCYGEEEQADIPIPDRPYCRHCLNAGEDRIRREYGVREQEILQDVDTENWSTEALNSARRELNRAQKDKIRDLRSVGSDERPSAKTERSADIEAQAGTEAEI